MHSETAYLFRHVLLREASYQLQLPGDRARLHSLALGLIEGLFGGRPPAPHPIEKSGPSDVPPHPTDPVAEELGVHARISGAGELADLYARRAAAFHERGFRLAEAQRCWEEIAATAAGVERGEALRRAADAATRRGRMADGLAWIDVAIDEFRRAGAARFEASALALRASLHNFRGRPEEAEADCIRALALRCGDRVQEGGLLRNLAVLLQTSGRPAESERRYEEALEVLREGGPSAAEGSTLTGLATLYEATGRAVEAEALHRRALEIHRALSDRRHEGIAMRHLGICLDGLGRRDEAREALQRALALNRETGDRFYEALSLAELAGAHLHAGRPADAERVLAQALAIHRELGNRRSEGVALANFARLHDTAGRREEAAQAWNESLAIFREVRHPGLEASTLCSWALHLRERGLHAEAGNAWRRGEAKLKELGDTATLQARVDEARRECGEAGFEELRMRLPRDEATR